jgi:hypothetical protein
MGWDACTQEANVEVRWFECHPGTASYVQAVGSILAILVAILAPILFDRHKRKSEARSCRRQILAVAYEVISLSSNVKSVYQTTEHMKKFLVAAHFPEKVGALQEAIYNAPWATIGDHTLFSVGQRLKANLAKLLGLYEESFVEAPTGLRLINQNSRIPVLVSKCADDLQQDAESVVRLLTR